MPGLQEAQLQFKIKKMFYHFTLQSVMDSCLELFAQLRSDEVGVQNIRTDAAWFPQYAEVEEVVLTGVLLTCSDSLALCNQHL